MRLGKEGEKYSKQNRYIVEMKRTFAEAASARIPNDVKVRQKLEKEENQRYVSKMLKLPVLIYDRFR